MAIDDRWYRRQVVSLHRRSQRTCPGGGGSLRVSGEWSSPFIPERFLENPTTSLPYNQSKRFVLSTP